MSLEVNVFKRDFLLLATLIHYVQRPGLSNAYSLIHHIDPLHANPTWKLGNAKFKLQLTLAVLHSYLWSWVT